MKIAHIYASNAKMNSGDFMIGIATKKQFEHKFLNENENNQWDDLDCRNAVTFKEENIHILNEKFDAIVVGGGGLILPDSSPNMVSCWQWVISKRCIEMIRIPIYVISIGFNLFYGQTLDMPSRDNNHSISSRTGIFRDNIETLIEKAEHFSIRHTDDRRRLFEVIDHRYEDKVSMELCPTIWYTNKYWGSSQGKYLAVEIKDDRMWRRYSRIQKQKYYDELIKFITWYAQNRDANIAYMCHDGSRDFYNYMNSKGIRIPFLNNTVANENMIKMNYAQVHTLLCMAGHSEMIGQATGKRVIPLVTHPKIAAFAEDVGITEVIPFDVDGNEIGDRLKSYFN